MSKAPGAGLYLVNATGCAEEFSEVELAALAGDAAAYYQEAIGHGEALAVAAGGGLSHVGYAPGDIVDGKDALALLRLQNPLTQETMGSAVGNFTTAAEKIEAESARLEAMTPEQRRAAERAIKKETQVGRAFYDVTYSAPKSVSVYYADLVNSGDFELANKVRNAHNEAVEYATQYLEDNTYVRVGAQRRVNGVNVGRTEKPLGLIRIAFQHTTSREKDPHLHSHEAIINRAPCADGKWRALHAQGWNKIKGAAASRYENKLAELIEERTPARFTLREDGKSRELVGIDPSVLEESSRRLKQVLAAEKKAVTKFKEDMGREPSPVELRKINKMAALESRARKDKSSPAEQLEAWGRRLEESPGSVAAGVHAAGEAHSFWMGTPEVPTPEIERAVVREALSVVQSNSATWNYGVLSAEIERRLPVGMTERAEQLAAEATQPGNPFGVVDLTRREDPQVPVSLMDADRAQPVWRDPALSLFALSDHLTMEKQLVTAAKAKAVEPWSDQKIEQLREQWRTSGSTITAEQADAVCAVLRSPRAGDVIEAAAGTGKSYTAGALAKAWQDNGGTVLGTATSQIASHVLSGQGVDAINATQFLLKYGNEHGQEQLPKGSLVVFDESNMTSTDQLRRVQEVVRRSGGKLLYMGDREQLDAVGAGGGFGLLADELGVAATLTEVRRFNADWEREASTRLRDGDTSVVEEYTRQGRIHGGTAEEMTAAAVDRYVADVAAGKTSALVTGTNESAAELSARVQSRLVQLGLLDEQAAPVGEGMDRNPLRPGDRLQWRENVYDLGEGGDGGALMNREFLKLRGVRDGLAELQREDNGSVVQVPADWLGERAVLGYAGTEHAYEGVTVDTAHTLIPGYVAMTRGRESNTAWLTTRVDGDAHSPGTSVTPQELFDLQAQGKSVSALEQHRAEIDAGASIPQLAAIWDHVAPIAMRKAAADAIAEVLGENAVDLVLDEDGGQRLVSALAHAELSGTSQVEALRTAVEQRSLDDAKDVAHTLAYRLEERASSLLEPPTWSERVSRLSAGDDEHGQLLGRIARRMDDRAAELGRRIADQQPEWARTQLGELPEAGADRERWEQRAGRIAAYRERCGISDALPSIGPVPHQHNTAELLAWRDAARSGARPVDPLHYMNKPNSDLEADRARWQRLAAHAPVFAEPELARARQQHDRTAADAQLLRLAADKAEAGQREEIARRAEAAERLAAESAARAQVLEEAYQARTQWLTMHERDQDAAIEAERELIRRGVKPEGETELDPQLELFQLDPVQGLTEQAKARVEREHQAAEQLDHEHQAATLTEEVENTQEIAEPGRAQESLFEVESSPRDVVRAQPLEIALDDEQQRDTAVPDVLIGPALVADASRQGTTIRDLETQVKYAKEMLERRKEKDQTAAPDTTAEDQQAARRATLEAERQAAEQATAQREQQQPQATLHY